MNFARSSRTISFRRLVTGSSVLVRRSPLTRFGTNQSRNVTKIAEKTRTEKRMDWNIGSKTGTMIVCWRMTKAKKKNMRSPGNIFFCIIKLSVDHQWQIKCLYFNFSRPKNVNIFFFTKHLKFPTQWKIGHFLPLPTIFKPSSSVI